MSGSRAAIRYAKAILSFALEQNKEVEVNNDMLLIATTVEESKDLQLLLSSPIIKSELIAMIPGICLVWASPI